MVTMETGWMVPPGPDGKHPGDTKEFLITDNRGQPVGVATLDVDYFGDIDDSLVPAELDGAVAVWVD
jgi:hypothetical protein